MTTDTSIYEYARQGLLKNPDKIAIWFYGRAMSYRELFLGIDATAVRLASLGVTKGTVVTVRLPNCPQTVMAIYAIAKLGMGEHIASLTTINTPHRGCLYAEYLLTKVPERVKRTVANTYNAAVIKLGEPNADFMAAVQDLTESRLRELNAEMPTPEGIYCQSVGSVLKKASSGKFPMNFSHRLVKYFSGDSDGLVATDSFQWGENYTLLEAPKKRGISHGDMIDLNRENIPGFDVREFYVQLVAKLKEKGF